MDVLHLDADGSAGGDGDGRRTRRFRGRTSRHRGPRRRGRRRLGRTRRRLGRGGRRRGRRCGNGSRRRRPRPDRVCGHRRPRGMPEARTEAHQQNEDDRPTPIRHWVEPEHQSCQADVLRKMLSLGTLLFRAVTLGV